jgi:hypothetical protein
VTVDEVHQVYAVLAKHIGAHESAIKLPLTKLNDIPRGVVALPLQTDLSQPRTHLPLRKTLLDVSVGLVIGPQPPHSHADVQSTIILVEQVGSHASVGRQSRLLLVVESQGVDEDEDRA